MNKKLKEFSDKYNAKKLIMANEDTLICYLENKGKWLMSLLGDEGYDMFVKEMAQEIEGYQRWMYLTGMTDATDKTKYYTKSGLPVRIVCTNLNNAYPVVGLIHMGTLETPHMFTKEGKHFQNTFYDIIDFKKGKK